LGWAEIAPRFASLYEELLASSSRQQVARLTGRRAHAVQVDESLTDLAALVEVLECDGQVLLALPPKPLVVELLDGVVERRQLVAATIRDVQRVINGLGPVSA
jgi:hypothetical protein